MSAEMHLEFWVWGMAQWRECFYSMLTAEGLILSTAQTACGDVCLQSQHLEGGDHWSSRPPWLLSEFEASLGYKRLSHKTPLRPLPLFSMLNPFQYKDTDKCVP